MGNTRLHGDKLLDHLLPIQSSEQLFAAVQDGMLLCKLINVAVADTIDERAINRISPSSPSTFHITENLNLALNAAKGIGLTVVNIGAQDMIEGRPHLVLGLVWQLVKMSLLSKINLKENPFLIRLLQPGETLEELLKLPPEQLLMRWFNYHLDKANVSRRATNFGSDLRDSELYAHLLQQVTLSLRRWPPRFLLHNPCLASHCYQLPTATNRSLVSSSLDRTRALVLAHCSGVSLSPVLFCRLASP